MFGPFALGKTAHHKNKKGTQRKADPKHKLKRATAPAQPPLVPEQGKRGRNSGGGKNMHTPQKPSAKRTDQHASPQRVPPLRAPQGTDGGGYLTPTKRALAFTNADNNEQEAGMDDVDLA